MICHSFPARFQLACPRHMQLHGGCIFGTLFFFFFILACAPNWMSANQKGRPMSSAITGLNFKVSNYFTLSPQEPPDHQQQHHHHLPLSPTTAIGRRSILIKGLHSDTQPEITCLASLPHQWLSCTVWRKNIMSE